MEVTTISRIGLAGLAVMSQNLALDIAEKGFLVSVYNNTKPLDRQHKVLGVVETLERQLSFLLCALNCLDWDAYLNPKMRYCGFGCWEFTVVGRHCGRIYCGWKTLWLVICLSANSDKLQLDKCIGGHLKFIVERWGSLLMNCPYSLFLPWQFFPLHIWANVAELMASLLVVQRGIIAHQLAVVGPVNWVLWSLVCGL